MVTDLLPVGVQHKSISTFVFYFVGYIIIHLILIIAYNKQIEKLKYVKEKDELVTQIAILKILKTWWPAIFIILFIAFNIF